MQPSSVTRRQPGRVSRSPHASPGEIVAQLTKTLPAAPCRRESPASRTEDTELGRIVGDHSEDDLSRGRDLGERGGVPGAYFLGEAGGGGAVDIIHGGDGVAAVFQTARHVGAHPTDADKCDGFRHGGLCF
jgi:hypothetical protein